MYFFLRSKYVGINYYLSIINYIHSDRPLGNCGNYIDGGMVFFATNNVCVFLEHQVFCVTVFQGHIDWPLLSIKLRLCSFTHGKSLNYTILSKIYKASKTGVLINKNKQSPLEHLSIKAPLFDSLLFPHTYFQIYQLWFNYVIKFARRRHACFSCVCNLESCAENVDVLFGKDFIENFLIQ